MKKKGIFACLVVLSLFAANGVCAFDLWEGFTTEMTKDELLARAREVLKVGSQVSERQVGAEEITNYDNLRSRFPQNLTIVELVSPLPAFAQNPDFFDSSKKYPNVKFYLSNNKLFYVTIFYAFPAPGFGNTSPELIAMVTKQYGNPEKAILERNGYKDTFYKRETPEKNIYCQGTGMGVLNKQMLKK
jgi:hypothetical protein